MSLSQEDLERLISDVSYLATSTSRVLDDTDISLLDDITNTLIEIRDNGYSPEEEKE